MRKHRYIVRNAWSIAGARIHVESVKQLHEDGYLVEQIIANLEATGETRPCNVTDASAAYC